VRFDIEMNLLKNENPKTSRALCLLSRNEAADLWLTILFNNDVYQNLT